MEESKEDTISIQNTNNIIESDEDNDYCPICLDDFEEEKLKYLTCGCGTSTCINCSKEYLLQSSKEPHCHKCHRGWDRTFQYDNFGKNWINNIYKKKIKEIILEKELSLMPETMPFVEINIKTKELTQKIRDCDTELKVLKQKLAAEKYNQNKVLIYNIKQKIIDEQNKKHELKTERTSLNYGSFEVNTKKRFIKPCPADNCRGFLSSSYKCGLCKIFVCPKCFEIIGLNKNNEHTCKQSDIDAANMIKKETKPCPKCGVPIFKISGCNQMWCTICHISFSWRTGKIEVGNIHNPHFHEWNRQKYEPATNGAAAGAEFDPCQGQLSVDNFTKTCNTIKGIISEDYLDYIHNVYRGIHHLRFILRNLKRELEINNRDIRVRYLMKEINDKQLSKTATQRYNVREKKNSMCQILELVDNVITDQYRDFHTTITDIFKNGKDVKNNVIISCENLFKTIKSIRSYSNQELIKVSKNYNMKVYFIPPYFNIFEKKLVNHYVIEKLITIENTSISNFSCLLSLLFDNNIKYFEPSKYIDSIIQLCDILTLDNYEYFMMYIVKKKFNFTEFIDLIINLFYKTDKNKELTNEHLNNSKDYTHRISDLHSLYRNSNVAFINLNDYLIDKELN